MKRKTLIIALVLASCVVGRVSGQGVGWRFINAKIRQDFPNVRRITTAELAAWLNDPRRAAPLLLDVRTRAEYDVSHLPGARHVEPDAAADVLRERRDRPIVTYCSVGYRSGRFAERLRAAGFSDVANLEGSIFRWANEGRPVCDARGLVSRVHPYNSAWGLLLDRKYRSDVTAAR
jgi:rhodanese-related sulfurtransferase